MSHRLCLAAIALGVITACSGASVAPHLGGEEAPSALRGCWRLQGGAEKGKPVGYRVPIVMAEGTIYCFDETGYVVHAPSGHRDRVEARWQEVEAGRWSSVEAPRRVFALDSFVPGADAASKMVRDQALGDVCTMSPALCPEEPQERSIIFDPKARTLDVFDGGVPVDRVADDTALWAAAASLPDMAEVQKLERACHEAVTSASAERCPDGAGEHRRCGGLASCRVQAERHEQRAVQCKVEPVPAPCRRVMALTQSLLP